MRVTFELEDDEDGCFERAEFTTSSKHVFVELCEHAVQFLYPFVRGSCDVDLSRIISEMVEGSDGDSFVRMLNFVKWETEEVEQFRDAVAKELERRKSQGDQQP